MTQAETCTAVPEFERLSYFYGQLLGIRDFKAEQAYFREKLKLHLRCLHGYGVVCGLLATARARSPLCPIAEQDQARELQRRLLVLQQEIKATRARLDSLGPGTDRDEVQAKLEQLLVEEEVQRRRLEALCPLPDDCETSAAALDIACGLAIDGLGNELVVRHPLCVDLWRMLSLRHKEIVRHQQGSVSLYVSLCFCEQGVEPTRPIHQDSCGSINACEYGRIRDGVKLVVSLDPPEEDDRCDTCCQAPQHPCVLLARVDNFHPSLPLIDADIHNEVRRPLGPYQATVITGINWVHGANYPWSVASKILGTGGDTAGLELRFSKPVHRESITPGVLDIWIIEGGKGRSAGIYHMAGDFHSMSSPLTDRVFYRQNTDETLNRGDRVLIRLRAGFLLDRCGRPVDGNHVGGKVPLLEEYPQFTAPPAYPSWPLPPRGYAPWTSGDGIPGGDFESWFYIS